MTIIATEDTRGEKTSTSTSSFGHKMLTKMGWSEGKGLGKNQHGQTNALRAVRREENLGIGATTDTHGGEGWTKTNTGFHGVLELLKMEHGSKNGSSSESSKDKKKNKKKKSKRKDEKKKNNKRELRLAQNKVQAGHARKMRESKNISTKSKEDMAAIFGIRPEDVPTTASAVVERPAEVTPISSDVNSSSDDDDEDNIVVVEEKKSSTSKKDKKQKKKKKDKKDKKRKRSSDDDEEMKKKKKKDKKEVSSSSGDDDGKKKKKKRRIE